MLINYSNRSPTYLGYVPLVSLLNGWEPLTDAWIKKKYRDTLCLYEHPKISPAIKEMAGSSSFVSPLLLFILSFFCSLIPSSHAPVEVYCLLLKSPSWRALTYNNILKITLKVEIREV